VHSATDSRCRLGATRKPATFTVEAQHIWAEAGFRPVVPEVIAETASLFPGHIDKIWTIKELGAVLGKGIDNGKTRQVGPRSTRSCSAATVPSPRSTTGAVPDNDDINYRRAGPRATAAGGRTEGGPQIHQGCRGRRSGRFGDRDPLAQHHRVSAVGRHRVQSRWKTGRSPSGTP